MCADSCVCVPVSIFTNTIQSFEIISSLVAASNLKMVALHMHAHTLPLLDRDFRVQRHSLERQWHHSAKLHANHDVAVCARACVCVECVCARDGVCVCVHGTTIANHTDCARSMTYCRWGASSHTSSSHHRNFFASALADCVLGRTLHFASVCDGICTSLVHFPFVVDRARLAHFSVNFDVPRTPLARDSHSSAPLVRVWVRVCVVCYSVSVCVIA